MLEKLIPKTFAQGFSGTVSSTATVGKDVAVGGAESGIQELVTFVVSNIDNWIAGLIIVIISWVVAKTVAGSIKKEIIIKKGEDVQESVLILVERMTTIIILTVGVTIAAAINGLNFTAVIGAMSLGIGFALKDIIGNFISGIIMLSQDRIRIGDLIKIGDMLGTIVSIDTRATILQSIDGTEVVIPNQSMLNETIVSFTTNPFRRIELVVGVDYGTDLPMVTSLIKGILDKDKDIVPKPEPLILVDEFGDSAINIKVLFWIESSNNWLKVRSNLANRIKKTFNELNINIPFPIRTLKLDEDDRSFLKTMDSMKKGYVPEPKAVQSKEEIIQAAEGTENAPQVPEQIFSAKSGSTSGGEKEKATPAPKATTKPASAPAPAPAGMHAAAPAEAPAKAPAAAKPAAPAPQAKAEAPKKVVKPTEPPAAPPTHL